MGTVNKAASLAERAYDEVIIPILDQVAESFCMDREKFFDMLHAFCARSKETDKETEKIGLLRKFIDRNHFKHMYVGCVLNLTVPMLFCIVLPIILQKGGGKQPRAFTEENYKENIEHIRKSKW